ncbi:class I SAM-dependent methyltransferase [Salinithrix halophila]|uniref:Class I SAM-dependent methyltransferase n=1 Tax=Salinithrix halophila TaxID=1485204 RepID=A0ABV8JGQ1_9BACL
MNPQTYWNQRYEQGRVWGDEPCPSATDALPFFQRAGVKSVLVPGCGYGRNAMYFAQQGFTVTAFDLSDVSIDHAKKWAAREGVDIRFFQGDLFYEYRLKGHPFDAVYLSNVIHLFLKDQRAQLLQNLTSLLRQTGIFIFSCISTSDPNNYGIGQEVEPNTFIKHESKPLHFYTERELHEILEPNYHILEQRLHTQTETDPAGNVESLQLWFVATEKR